MSGVRHLTYLIFAYTCVEGLVINVMYPNTLPFIFKDFAILLAYLALLTGSTGGSGSLAKISTPLVVFAGVTGFFLFMPSQVSLLGELVALKQRLFYIPLVYVGYHFMRDEHDVLTLLRVMAWTAIPVSIFGIYLFFVGPVGLTSLGANYSAIVESTSGERGMAFWRVPGTFTSPGQYGMFLLANGVLFVGVLFSGKADGRLRLLTIVSLVTLLGALLVSGSRSPLLLLMLCSLLMLVFTGRLKGIAVWASGLYGALALGFVYFGGGVQDRVGSIASWEHVDRFSETYFGQLFLPMLMQSPMGFGLGRATIGARHFTDWANIMLMESYFGILAAETGVLGLASFLWALVMIIAVLASFRFVMRKAPNGALWYSIVSLCVAIAAILPVGTAIDSAPSNLYFWTFLGIAFKMHDLELARRRSRQVPGGAPGAFQPAMGPPAAYLGFR